MVDFDYFNGTENYRLLGMTWYGVFLARCGRWMLCCELPEKEVMMCVFWCFLVLFGVLGVLLSNCVVSMDQRNMFIHAVVT